MRPYYEHGGVTIYHGDCREVLATITADALITDPPYGVNLGAHAAAHDLRERRRKGSYYLNKGGYATYVDTPENFAAVVVPAVNAALTVTKRGLVFCAAHMAWGLPPPSAIGGVYLPSGCGRNAWGFASLAHCLLYGSAPDIAAGCRATAIRSTERSHVNGHPCPKPDGWMKWAVGLASMPGEIVLDPFMGSGTTLRAAKDLGRRAIGIEIEERYCEIAAKRLAQEVLL